MNTLHMKYAVEIARQGSINKASEVLFVAQPNLSRSVKELEADLGITIFERTAKGMILTPAGEEFIGYAEKILNQIEEVESLYKSASPKKQRFSVSVPRASYIAEAFANFTKTIGSEPAEIFYNETNSLQAINNILLSNYKLGIIRFDIRHEKYMKVLFDEKKLSFLPVSQFRYVLLMSRDNPLSEKENIEVSDLEKYIEIAHADTHLPSVPLSEIKKGGSGGNSDRKIFVFERAGQFDILKRNSKTFMWVSPIPKDILDSLNLVQRSFDGESAIYEDVLIYRKNYTLSKLDKMFIGELEKSKNENIK